MIEALAAISGTGFVGSLAVIVWLVVKYVQKTDALADARVAQSHTESHLEEAQYKLAQTQLALTSALKLNDAQQKELADAIGTQPNTDLPPDDVHGRLVRWLAANTSAATDARAANDSAVPANGTAVAASPRAG